MGDKLVVTSSNSPYPVPGPAATYDSVTIKPGGILQFSVATTMTTGTLIKENQ